jgi:hypothetical protein
MAQWLSVTFGVAAGLALVVGALFVAFRPSGQAGPRKPRMPDPADPSVDFNAASTWSDGDYPHTPGGDGHGP